MKLATLIALMLKASIALLVFNLGLDVTIQEATFLLRGTGRLLRSLLAMNVIMPLATAALVAAFDLHPAVKIALVALAVSPVPPLLPMKELKVGGGVSFTLSLLTVETVFAILSVPISIGLLAKVFDVPAPVSPVAVAEIVSITVLMPLSAGMLVRRSARTFAERVAAPVSRLAIALLAASLIPILIAALPLIVSLIGNGTLAAIAAFIIMGMAAGHLLGGPKPEERTALALSTSSRHPAVALAIASAGFPAQKLALATILLYLIVNAVVSLPYLAWRRHTKIARAGVAGSSGKPSAA